MGWLIYGTGEHAKVVIDLLELLEEKIDYMFDDNYEGGLYEGHPSGKYTEDLFPMANFIIAIGNNADRKKIAEKMSEYKATSLIHPKSTVSSHTEIGNGTLILANAVIQSNVQIGKHCLIDISVNINHDALIHDYVNIAPTAYIGSETEIGEGAYIGAGAIITRGSKIAPWTVIAEGEIYRNEKPLTKSDQHLNK